MIHSDRHESITTLHCQNPCCIFEKGWPPCFSHVTILLPPSSLSPRSTETKCRTGANSSSRKKRLAEPRSLTKTNFILIENTNRIEIELSFHIDIPSTQHRSSKGSRRPTKARKPGSFRKWIPIRRVHNRMDKLTLTRQFGIQFGSLGGIGKELECNNIDSSRYRRKGSLLIQTLYLRDRDRERRKNRGFHIVLLIEKSIWFFSYFSLNDEMGQILQDQTLWELRNDGRK